MAAIKRGVLILLATLLPMSASACLNDGDCTRGGVCFFTRGQDEGRCMTPEVILDQNKDVQRLKTPLRKRYGQGYPCQFSVDCLPDYACFKRPGNIDGVCVRR